MDIIGFLRSKKVKTLIIGLIAQAIVYFGGLPESVAASIAGMIAAYLLGQGLADGLSGGKTSSGNGGKS